MLFIVVVVTGNRINIERKPVVVDNRFGQVSCSGKIGGSSKTFITPGKMYKCQHVLCSWFCWSSEFALGCRKIVYCKLQIVENCLVNGFFGYSFGFGFNTNCFFKCK